MYFLDWDWGRFMHLITALIHDLLFYTGVENLGRSSPIFPSTLFSLVPQMADYIFSFP